jgi:hypothetical protein
MSASISDLLTTMKNGVVGINTLASAFRSTINLGRGPMELSYAVLYTVPKDTTIMVSCIDICNTSGSAQTVYVSFVPSGDTVGTGNAILYGFSIAANDIYQWSGEQVLSPGDTIQGYASATSCTIMVSGSAG